MRRTAALLLAACIASPAPAQVPVLPPKGQPGVVAIVGGTVLPVSGPAIPRGTVVIHGKKIEAVGPELPPPPGATVVDATGKYVTPGLVLIEGSGIGLAGMDGNMADSLDPYQLALRVALASGITTVNLVDTPFFGFFGDEIDALSGASSAIIKLTYGDLDSMLVREPGLNYFAMPTRQLELNLHRIREGFRKASEHLKAAKEAEAKKAAAPRLAPEIAPYVTILENKRPTVVAARTVEDVRAILEIERDHHFDLVLSRPEEAFQAVHEIASRGCPVLLKARGADFNFDLTTPVVDDDGLIPIRYPAAYSGRGVTVALLPYRRGISMDGLAGRDASALAMEAAFAVRGGLDEGRALEAITIEPARVLRVADRLGSLEKGKDADVLIWSRHPLHYRSFVEKAFINGKVYYEREKSPLFRDVPLR